MIGRVLGELVRVVERQVAVHLVGGDVMVPDIVLAHGLEQAEGAHDVRLHKRFGVRDRIVVVGLGGVMHNGVMARHDPVKQLRVADIAMHEIHAIRRDALQVIQVTRIRQRIQHRHMRLRMMIHHIMHEIRTDKTGPTGHDDVLRNKQFSHTYILSHTAHFEISHTDHAHFIGVFFKKQRCCRVIGQNVCPEPARTHRDARHTGDSNVPDWWNEHSTMPQMPGVQPPSVV